MPTWKETFVLQISSQHITMLFSRKFEDSLANPKIRAELVSYKHPEEKACEIWVHFAFCECEFNINGDNGVQFRK